MTHLTIKDILAGKVDVGSPVVVEGWIRTRRDSKAGLSFLQVHDGSCFEPIQVVAEAITAQLSDRDPAPDHALLRARRGHADRIAGQGAAVRGQGRSSRGGRLGREPGQLPGLVQAAHAWSTCGRWPTCGRGPTRSARSRGCATACRWPCTATSTSMVIIWVHTPIITTSDAEGAGAMFRVSTLDLANLPRDEHGGIDFSADFFGKPASLTVSGQLNVEAYCLALSRVYTFGPTFRAENSNTTRHLAEFWMIEPEIAFADLNDDADLAEDFLKNLLRTVLEERADDMAFFAQHIDKDCINRLETFINATFERMDYGDAIKALEAAVAKGHKFEFPVKWGIDLQSEHERYLTETLVGRPIVVMNYPKQIKAFYMRVNDDGKTVAAMDVLAPGIGELIGGSQREERLDVLDARLDEIGLPKEQYNWYRDLRRYGTVPHAGFGLGFERTIVYVTGMVNIRDVIPFPRTPGNAEF